MSRTAKPRSSLAPVSLPRIGGDEASIDIRLKIKGKAAADLADYRQAYIAGHDQEVDLNPDDGLNGERPIEVLRRGEVERVVESARRVGVQGA